MVMREAVVRFPVEPNIFISSGRSDRLWGPSSSYLMRAWGEGHSSGLKRPGCEADHSPPASAEVKKTWIYTSTHPYVSMA
jgi:hypothetical protein